MRAVFKIADITVKKGGVLPQPEGWMIVMTIRAIVRGLSYTIGLLEKVLKGEEV